ncbi:MAG: flagellar hook-length control protein FliK [Luteibacter sp.]
MNNATVALNVARPVSTASSASAANKSADDASPSHRFDAAMDAARATHATKAPAPVHRDPHGPARADRRNDAGDDDGASTQASKDGPADGTTTAKSGDDGKPATVKADRNGDDDAAKKTAAAGDDDTSLASTMLALIGVPPKVTELAGKALGALKDVTGKAGAVVGDAIGLPGTAALPVDGVKGAAKDGVLAATDAVASAAVATPVAASPFAALLAGAGVAVPGAKDEAVKATDPTTSPMPLTHAPGLVPVDGAAVQVQATQAATSPQFAQELGEQIAWMGNGEIKEARIKLHPEELGSMDVRVNIDGGKVNVAIMAQHPAAVHAVQQTLSQLDTLLAHHGLSLGQADVGQRQTGQGGDSQGGGNGGQGGAGDPDAAGPVVTTSRVSRSLVDEVA